MRHHDELPADPSAALPGTSTTATLGSFAATLAGCADTALDSTLVELLDEAGPRLGVEAITVWGSASTDAPAPRMFSWRHEPTPFESDAPGEGAVRVEVAGAGLTCAQVEIETSGVDHAPHDELEILAALVGQATARREHAERFHAAFANAGVAMSIRAVDGRLVACNPAYRLLHGLGDDDVLDDVPLHLVHDEDIRTVEACRTAVLEGHSDQYQLEARLHTPAGERWVRVACSAIRSADGTLTALLSLLTDIDQERRTGEILEHHATHDDLTGLPNRLLTMHAVDGALHRSGRHGGVLGLLLVDIDHFKQVNDSFGHDAGDELLVGLGKRIRAAVREADFVGRLGGDEFCIIAEDCESPRTLAEISDRVHRAVSTPIVVAGNEITPSVSIGISVAEHVLPATELLREADVALYRAKSEGRARTDVFDSEMRAHVLRRSSFADDLRRGLAAGELVLFGQPEVDLRTGLLRAVEVYVRWQHPTRGLLEAGDFAPEAVEAGVISEVDDWVLHGLVATLDDVRTRPGVPMRLNVAGHTLRQPGWAAGLTELWAPLGARLTVEISARDLVGDLARLQPAFHALSAAGIGVVLDDFGLDGSGLKDLRAIPASVVKLDHSLVADSDARPRGAQILGALIQLADALGLETVAEGVETPSQLTRLRSMGCTAGQGRLLAKPSPLHTLLASFS